MINLELEKSILSCMLIDNALIETATKEITSQDFYGKAYELLFAEIVERRNTTGYADITNLKSVPIETLVEVSNFAPTCIQFKSYLKELKELSMKRKLARQLERLKVEINNNNLEEIKSEVLNLACDIKIEDFVEEKTDICNIVLESLTQLESKYNNMCKQFPKWGFKWFDEKTGGVKPGLTYLAARPSVGKTAFALQIALNVAKQGVKVGIFSLEMDKVSLCNRLICNYGNIKKDYFDKAISIPDEVWKQISLITPVITEMPISIYDKAYSIEEILLLAREQQATQGLDFLILDYIQLCETSYKCNSPNERITYISRQLKKFQQQTGIHILALSQLNRESERKEFPTLSSLRDSGSLEQDANMVIFLHEDFKMSESTQESSKEILLIIAKQREGERNIYSSLKFYGVTQRFY